MGTKRGVVRDSRAFRLIVLPALAAGAIAGCGGGDDDENSGGLSAQEFTKQSNLLCRQSTISAGKVTREVLRDPAIRRLPRDERNAAIVERIVASSQPSFAKLEQLEPPADVKKDFDQFLDRLREAYRLLGEVAAAYRKADFTAVDRLNKRVTALSQPTLRFTQKYGLSDCGGVGPVGSPGS